VAVVLIVAIMARSFVLLVSAVVAVVVVSLVTANQSSHRLLSVCDA
jgi:hypothetical protein